MVKVKEKPRSMFIVSDWLMPVKPSGWSCGHSEEKTSISCLAEGAGIQAGS